MSVQIETILHGVAINTSQVFYTYTFGTAGWLGLQAVPLVIMPKLVIAMLANEGHRATGRKYGWDTILTD